MLAGVAAQELSPACGVELGGYPYVTRANTGVHDPLWAVALYLAPAEGVPFLLVATDLFWITQGQARRVREGIAARTGIPVDRLVVTASHTHSAPWMTSAFDTLPGQGEQGSVDQEYVDQAIGTCIQVAVEATENVFEAEIGTAVTRCGRDQGIGGNRRDPVNGTEDADVPVLAVRDTTGRLRAVWTKYALHPTILDAENTLVSADFPGSLRSALVTRHPGVAFLYSMGTAGDQSSRYHREGQTFEEVARFGTTLADAVLSALGDVEYLSDPPIEMRTRTIDLVPREYPASSDLDEKVAALRAQVTSLEESGAGYIRIQTAKLGLLGAECELSNAKLNEQGTLRPRYEACAPFSVHAARIADTAWVFLPGEVFCDFGMRVKERSPHPGRTHVVTMANGDLPGYCVTWDALEEGGYEPGNSLLSPESGDRMVDTALELLNELEG